MTVNRIQPNLELIDLLQDAYAPCKNFGVCPEACWQPANGHIPRGFLGATGDLSEVELIMLFAQPGAPHDEERYDPGAHSTDLLLASVEHAYKCFSTSKYSFHRNAIWFLKQLYPDLSFDEQLRRIWMTEGRLCSIANEDTKDGKCAKRYLKRQLDMLPNATTVAFGGKAQHYMQEMSADCVKAFSLSPRGPNLKKARRSWEKAIAKIKGT